MYAEEEWFGERNRFCRMIRIAVVEDEQRYIDQIKGYLEQYEVERKEALKITIFHDGDEIVANYRAQFDIILMDIQMKFIDGLSAADEIRMIDSEVVIIFITNMTQYVIRGYAVNALDYVIKPVTYFAFSQKLDKAIEKLKKRVNNYVIIAIKGGVLRTAVDDIYYVESIGHKLIYHTVKGEVITTGTIKSAEEQLKDFGFCRSNKGYLLNLEHVDGVKDKCAVVRGENLQISRPRFGEFMQALTRYWGEM